MIIIKSYLDQASSNNLEQCISFFIHLLILVTDIILFQEIFILITIILVATSSIIFMISDLVLGFISKSWPSFKMNLMNHKSYESYY